MTSNRPARYSRSGRVIENVRIDQDRERLVEAADQVLAVEQIYAGFAADSRIDLALQSGGNLQYRDAAHEDGGQKAGHVVHDAAAEGDNHAGAVASLSHHLFGQCFHVRQPLAFLAAGEKEDLVGDARETPGECLAVEAPDIFSSDDENLAGPFWNVLCGTREKPPFHRGAVVALRSLDGERRHMRVVPRQPLTPERRLK